VIRLPPGSVMAGGVDVMKLLQVLLDIIVDKNVVNENELAGYLVRAGFSVHHRRGDQGEEEIDEHNPHCVCMECKRERELKKFREH